LCGLFLFLLPPFDGGENPHTSRLEFRKSAAARATLSCAPIHYLNKINKLPHSNILA